MMTKMMKNIMEIRESVQEGEGKLYPFLKGIAEFVKNDFFIFFSNKCRVKSDL